MGNVPIVKKSSLDLRAPDDVKIVYCLCDPPTRVGGKMGIPHPFFESEDPVEVERKSAELTRLRQNHIATTIWRDKATNKKVPKWNRVRTGTQREYLVKMPWVEGITHEAVSEAISTALYRMNPAPARGSVVVRVLPPKAESGTV